MDMAIYPNLDPPRVKPTPISVGSGVGVFVVLRMGLALIRERQG